MNAGRPPACDRAVARFRRCVGRCGAGVRDAIYSSRARSRFSRRRLCRDARQYAGGGRLSADARPQQGPRSCRRHPYAGEDRSVSGIHPASAAGKARAMGRRRPRAVLRSGDATPSCGGLRRRSTPLRPRLAKTGLFPIPVLTRDIPGYLITPHTDTRWKGITVQLYLPQRPLDHAHRHHLPREAAPTAAAPKTSR